MTDLGKIVDKEYGEGWDLKRTAATIVLALGILGGAVYGAMRSYTPAKTEQRTERTVSQYDKRVDYIAVEK